MADTQLLTHHRVGIAFSGGSVRGFAHLGAWEVLQQHGIRPHCVSGASVGSIFAVLVAAGLSAREIYERARTLNWRRLARPTFPWHLGLFTLTPLEHVIEELLGGPLTFADLPIPCALMAFDIEKEEMVILREGPVARAVRASCAVPGIFSPVRWQGRLLADGGIVRNMPVHVLREMGATLTIGIDLMPPTRRPQRVRTLVGMIRIAMYTLVRMTHEIDPPDVLIQPDIREFDFVRFSQRDALIARGREAARAVLPVLQSHLTSHLTI